MEKRAGVYHGCIRWGSLLDESPALRRALSEHLGWEGGGALLKGTSAMLWWCPDTSPATCTPSKFCLQPGFEYEFLMLTSDFITFLAVFFPPKNNGCTGKYVIDMRFCAAVSCSENSLYAISPDRSAWRMFGWDAMSLCIQFTKYWRLLSLALAFGLKVKPGLV